MRLVGDVTQAGSLILPVAYGIAQSSISHGGNDGVGVGVAMAGNINRIHTADLLISGCTKLWQVHTISALIIAFYPENSKGKYSAFLARRGEKGGFSGIENAPS